MKRESQRVMETKEKIRNAFFELYAAKKIEQISIKEITEKANLNRSTFYIYYQDLFDFLEKIENDISKELSDIIKINITMFLRNDSSTHFYPLIEFCQKYNRILPTLLGPNGDPRFITAIKKNIRAVYQELLQKEYTIQIQNIEYVIEYISSAHIGIITYWIQNGMSLAAKDLGEMIRQNLLCGTLAYLKTGNSG